MEGGEFNRALYLTYDFLPYKGQETIEGPIPLFAREVQNISLDHFNLHIDHAEKNSRLEERLSEAKKNNPGNTEFIEWAEMLVTSLKAINLDPPPPPEPENNIP